MNEERKWTILIRIIMLYSSLVVRREFVQYPCHVCLYAILNYSSEYSTGYCILHIDSTTLK